MPKKYHQRSLLTKPSSSAPSSLSLTRAEPHQHDSSVPVQRSVNDLIRESRRATGNDQSAVRYQSSSSIHPTVRAVLDLPPPTPPSPRTNVRGPSRLRRIPGPPPPKSWLVDSRHAPDTSVEDVDIAHLTRTRTATQSSNLPGAKFPSSRSLQHVLLRHMATNWSWHAEYDHLYLTELPTKMKELLLSYIAIYNENYGPNPVKLLFPVEPEDDERQEVSRLDLSNAIGGWAMVKTIERELFASQPRLDAHQTQKKNTKNDELPDTWEDDISPELLPTLPAQISVRGPRFRNLKHLSLAAVPSTNASSVSWQDLLSLASKVRTIVSLSLAYWPKPTYTPNASASRVKVKTLATGSSPTVIYGGSDFYTAFDNNWREAAGILRALSRTLYCLNWLDLTGCGEWFPALVWRPDEDADDLGGFGPEWNGGWRDLERLTLAVGWSPGRGQIPKPSFLHVPDKHQIHASDTSTDNDLGNQQREHTGDPIPDTNTLLAHPPSRVECGLRRSRRLAPEESWIQAERDKQYHRKEVERYMELCNCAKKVGQDVRVIRKEFGGKWIDVDFGPKEEF